MADENSEAPLDISSISDAEWDEIFRQVDAERQAKKLRRDNPYALDIIRVLRGRETGVSRGFVLHSVERNRRRLGLPIPKTFEQAVQQSCERFCIDSDVFKERRVPREEAIFAWPKGKGAGHWAIRQPEADNWLRSFIQKRRYQIKRTGI